jgi:uncharacterized damage-inducible protein DinB
MMQTSDISAIFKRELNKLKEEVASYKAEPDVWKIPPGVLNSGGTLCLHICGNLNHFVGAVLGKTGYIRNREKEFSARNIPKAALIIEIEQTAAVVGKTLNSLTDDDLHRDYTALPPQVAANEKWTAFYFLIHLIAHLDYHIGQVNYHRRIVSGIVK